MSNLNSTLNPDSDKTRVAAYARFSSDKQRETSIVDQMRNCEEYAKNKKWAINYRFKDERISGSKHDRPGYQNLLAHAESKNLMSFWLMISPVSRAIIWKSNVYVENSNTGIFE